MSLLDTFAGYGEAERRAEKLRSLDVLGIPSSQDPLYQLNKRHGGRRDPRMPELRSEWELAALLGTRQELITRWRQSQGGAPDDPEVRERLDRAAQVADMIWSCAGQGRVEVLTPDYCRIRRKELDDRSILEIIKQEADAAEMIACYYDYEFGFRPPVSRTEMWKPLKAPGRMASLTPRGKLRRRLGTARLGATFLGPVVVGGPVCALISPYLVVMLAFVILFAGQRILRSASRSAQEMEKAGRLDERLRASGTRPDKSLPTPALAIDPPGAIVISDLPPLPPKPTSWRTRVSGNRAVSKPNHPELVPNPAIRRRTPTPPGRGPEAPEQRQL